MKRTPGDERIDFQFRRKTPPPATILCRCAGPGRRTQLVTHAKLTEFNYYGFKKQYWVEVRLRMMGQVLFLQAILENGFFWSKHVDEEDEATE
ncbi:hypothetical protein NDU88_009209 [Pleurodeles waltl]|uniref:Uncharacterized protein n=1 Tax=Pleurodeles waltl TaxID=8319 RepID=A0AAV7RYD9_PLEWA|nr:hypothetical protein NDU88_009209 [Pleurodeles waltl]